MILNLWSFAGGERPVCELQRSHEDPPLVSISAYQASSAIDSRASGESNDIFQEICFTPAHSPIILIVQDDDVAMVDLTGFFLRRISSIGKRPFANAIKDLVEPCFADKERIMLGSNLAVSVHEIEVSAVVGRDDQERPPTASEMEGPRSRQGMSQMLRCLKRAQQCN